MKARQRLVICLASAIALGPLVPMDPPRQLTANGTAGPQLEQGYSSTLTAEQQEILNHLSIVYLDDGQGGLVKTVQLTGANLRIVNGLGATDTANGVGNLIVGYNELGNLLGDDRTGSHNIVGGSLNSFSSAGGLVVGHSNFVSSLWASVSGGKDNEAFGLYSSVSGGWTNKAGYLSSVSGGAFNTATGSLASISGGIDNHASGMAASISGGTYNTATSAYASVSGGRSNSAGGFASSVSGGYGRTATAADDWAAGSLFEDD